jgi:hypothetical protein
MLHRMALRGTGAHFLPVELLIGVFGVRLGE